MALDKIFKKENIIKISPDDTLAHALSLLSSSHDAAFVVDKNQLLGIINPYYCVIKKSYPANTKAKHCMIRPPHIDIEFPLKKVIQLMLDTKIHYLPVFSGKNFYGFVSARQILTAIIDSKQLEITIKNFWQSKRELITLFERDTIGTAISSFKKHKISKIIVISNDLKLKGILAYYDLIFSMVQTNERHSKSKKDNKSLLRQFVKNYMRTTVLTLNEEHTLFEAAKMMLDRKIGSVIIIDKERHPIGIVTTRDLMSAYIRTQEKLPIEVVTKTLSDKSMAVVKPFIYQLLSKANHDSANGEHVQKMKIVLQEKEQGGIFKAIVSIIHRNNITVIKREGKNLLKLLNSLKEKIKK